MGKIKGYCRPDFIEIQNIFADSIASGHETGASIAIEHKGEMIVDLYGGYKDAAKNTPWEKDTLVNVFSVTKGVTAACVAMLVDMFNNMIEEMFDYGRYILKQKRENPKNDLLSAIANAQIEGEELSPEFLDGSWLLIIFAGNDTTRNTMSGGIKLLNDNPYQKKLVLEDSENITGLINETVRFVSPVIHMRRTSSMKMEMVFTLLQ